MTDKELAEAMKGLQQQLEVSIGELEECRNTLDQWKGNFIEVISDESERLDFFATRMYFVSGRVLQVARAANRMHKQLKREKRKDDL
jgi:hypothetical protein